MDYEQMRKDELQDEAERRDLPKSGTKAELIERLGEDGEPPGGNGARNAPRIPDILARARSTFTEITGLTTDAVSRVERVGDAWEATFEVVELERIPRSTDVLASYDVELDDAGNLGAWRRVRRYLRNQQEER